MVEEKLLDCPFCGDSVDIKDVDAIYPINREKTVWQCGCLNPKCNGSVLGDGFDDVIKLWNNRA